MKKAYIYVYSKATDSWGLASIIRFDEFDEDSLDHVSVGLVRNTGSEYPKQIYVGTLFNCKNTRVTYIDEGVEKVIFEGRII